MQFVLALSVLTCHPASASTGWMVHAIGILNWTHGVGPVEGEPLVAMDGLIYGTAYQGGSAEVGTIYRMDTNGILESFSFEGTNGALPACGLIQALDGSIYGNTTAGGLLQINPPVPAFGTVFRLTTNGVIEALFVFAGTNGNAPSGTLVLADDGALYGTARSGGPFTNNGGFGVVYKITTNGEFTSLAAFNGANGSLPTSLIQGDDGLFYGTTSLGGEFDLGTVFRMTPAGEITTLFSFAGTNGASPSGPVVFGSDGNIYGTTRHGGHSFYDGFEGFGTVFRLGTNGVHSMLCSFDGEAHAYPVGRLLEITNGVFLGATFRGGAVNYGGTIFQIHSNGQFSTLLETIFANGLIESPLSGLVPLPDGTFYGLSADPGFGAVFCLRPILRPEVHIRQSDGILTLEWNAWKGVTYQLSEKLISGDESEWSLVESFMSGTNGPVHVMTPIQGSGRMFRVNFDLQ